MELKYIKDLYRIRKKNNLDKVFSDDIILKKGPYGYYIKYKNTMNIAIPFNMRSKATSLTGREIKEIIEKKIKKPTLVKKEKNTVEWKVSGANFDVDGWDIDKIKRFLEKK